MPRVLAPRRRGAALLVAMVSVAVVTALTVDLVYQTRVSLQSAGNARDELRAEYLARSALNLSRLVLHFQQQLDRSAGAISGALQQPGGAGRAAGGAGGAGTAGGASAAAATSTLPGLSVRLWEVVPVDSSAAALFLGGGGAREEEPAPRSGDAAGAAPEAAPLRAFTGFEGAFRADIEDEDRKINVRQLNGVGALPAVQAARLAELVRDPKWDFLFNEDDANGIRATRVELLGNLRDWVDEDEVTSAFTGNALAAFEPGFGDEDAIYQRLPDPYQAKNAWADSVDELSLVAGVSDAFMTAFGDALTVYPDVNAQINVNATSRAQVMVNALVMADPPGVPQPPMLDALFPDRLEAALQFARPMPFMSITPQAFAAALQVLGVRVQPVYLQASSTDRRNAFGDRSTTFRIRAQGTAGAVTKSLDVVVLFDARAGVLAQDLGRVVHWKEE